MAEKRMIDMNQKELDEWWKEYRKTHKQPLGDMIVGAVFWIFGIVVLLLIFAAFRAAGGSY